MICVGRHCLMGMMLGVQDNSISRHGSKMALSTALPRGYMTSEHLPTLWFSMTMEQAHQFQNNRAGVSGRAHVN